MRATSRLVVVGLIAFLAAAMWRGAAHGSPPPRDDQAHAVATDASAQPAREGESHAKHVGHSDPFALILLTLAVIIVAAMVGRWFAERADQPPVLGELLIGVILGNIGYWLGWPLCVIIMNLDKAEHLFHAVWMSHESVDGLIASIFTPEQMESGKAGDRFLSAITAAGPAAFALTAMALWVFYKLGVILLLFMVGLESTVEEMLKVGPRATLVAVVGVIVPFALGYGASIALLPSASLAVHLFMGATLAATSVGITARVFKDLGRVQTGEAKIVLGAAVIDDVLGLIVLAVVAGIAVTGTVQAGEVVRITVISAVFLGAVILIGGQLVGRSSKVFWIIDRKHYRLLFPLALAFAMSWLAASIELAAIVGAFAAGLIIHERYFDHGGDSASDVTMSRLVAPLETVFAPFFFILIGMQVNLAAFANPTTIGIGLALIAAAIIGKLACGLVAGRGVDRLTVGIGMVPRGEVGLIFASIGKSLGVMSESVFSAVVLMVMVTTLITPPALKWSLTRRRAEIPPADPDAAPADNHDRRVA